MLLENLFTELTSFPDKKTPKQSILETTIDPSRVSDNGIADSKLTESLTLPNGTKIAKNPSPSNLVQLLMHSKNRSMRGLVFGPDMYWWDAYGATHGDVARELGDTDYIEDRLELKFKEHYGEIRMATTEKYAWARIFDHPMLAKLANDHRFLLYAGSAGWVDGHHFKEISEDADDSPLLTEGASSILYHATSLYNGMQILKQHRFHFSTPRGTGTEIGTSGAKHPYYMSTSRTRVGDYSLHAFYSEGVVFELNGDWIGTRYKVVPVDYWGRAWLPQGYRTGEGPGLKGRYQEAEERILSHEPYMVFPTPETKLIRAVHVLFVTEKEDERDRLRLKAVVFSAKKLKLPVFVYGNRTDFLLQNRAKSMSFDEIKSIIATGKPEPFGTTNIQFPRTDWLKPWRELYYKSDRTDLSKRASDYVKKIRYYRRDAVEGLMADIHNYRKDMPTGLIKLFGIWKKLGITTVQEYIDYLVKKWWPEDGP
jgi:hypothetical protein